MKNKKFRIKSWHQNGTDIWFYIEGREKSIIVDKECLDIIRERAIDDFREELKKILGIAI